MLLIKLGTAVALVTEEATSKEEGRVRNVAPNIKSTLGLSHIRPITRI